MFWKQSTASIHVFYKYEIAQKDGGVKKNLSEDPEAADIIDVPFPETPTSFLKEEWKKNKKKLIIELAPVSSCKKNSWDTMTLI